MEHSFGVTLPREKGYDTTAGLEAAARGDIDAAIIMGGNLWGATPDTAFATRAMDAIGFKLFLTTTLNRGHVHGLGEGEAMILPVTARDEEWSPTTQESMFNFVRLSDGGIERLDNVRPETIILCDLAARLLPDSPIPFAKFKEHSEVRKVIADHRARARAARRHRCRKERVPHPQPRDAHAGPSARPMAERISS